MIKLLFKLVAGLVALLLIGIVVLYFTFDRIVKKTVEVEGTDQLKVTTTLGGVSMGLMKGTVDLTDFSLGSPAGFSAPKMLSIGELKVDSGGISNLRGKPVHIKTIDLESPVLVVEEIDKKLNFKAMMDGLPSSPDQTSKPATQSDQTRLVIDSLTINNADVQMDMKVMMVKKHFDVKLPAITMTNLGNADGTMKGITIKDVVTGVISQMVANAAKSSGIPVDVQGPAQDLLNGNLASVKDKLSESAKAQLPPSVGNLLNGITGKPAPGAPGQPADSSNPLQNAEKGLLKNFGH